MSENKNLKAARLARLAVAAAMYAALTFVLSGISFGAVQFRFAELLVLLCFYRRDYCISMIVGCFVANCFSPMALMDMVFGTLATAVAVLPMFRMKNIWLASLLPVVSNAIIVAAELYIAFGQPLWLGMLTVGAGELVVVTIIGCPLYKVMEKNRRFMQLIGTEKNISGKKVDADS